MTTDLWVPLPDRLAGRGSLRSGIPAALRRPLREWIETQAEEWSGWAKVGMTSGSTGSELVERVVRRLGLDSGEEAVSAEWLAYGTQDKDLANIVDAILALVPRPDPADRTFAVGAMIAGRSRTAPLQQMLDDVRSVYTLRADRTGLELRAPTGAARAHAAVVKAAGAKPDAGSAARHLSAAWGAAFAVTPDPERSYSESIKAVEAAAHAVVEPRNGRATLGTMLGQLRASPETFVAVLAGSPDADGVGVVREMMAALWKGQTSRHGGMAETRPETVAEAQAAVLLVGTLVGWFVSGAVRRA